MTTPALSRATEALVHEFGLLPDEAEGMHDDAARAAVSAALHDPDDPDWLAKALYERDRLRAYARGEVWSVWDDLIDDAEEILDRYRDIAYDVGDIILEDGW